MTTDRVAIKDIAEALALTERGARKRAATQKWPFVEEVLPTGAKRRLYPLSSLPEEVRAAYRDRQARASLTSPAVVPAAVPAPRAVPPATSLRAHQRAAMEARARLLAEVDALQAGCGLSVRRAVLALVEGARLGTLRGELMTAIRTANARGGRGGSRTLSRSTVYGWLAARDQGAGALATRDGGSAGGEPAWAPYLLRAWRDPRKPALARVLAERLPALLPAGIPAPSYDQARRYLRGLSPQERERGRRGPRAMVALQQYTGRGTEGMEPTAMYTADGKLFPAKVANPLSGRPFKPEIVTVLDVATRRALGWSAALAETASGVADAFRRAVLAGGVPAIWYTDNGPGHDNLRLDDPLTGTLARLGTVNMDSLPDRSHSRGVIERFQAAWNGAAKALPSYLGKDMDPEAYKRLDSRIARDVKQFGESPLVMAWDDFLGFCQRTIDAYNARPHRGLPMTRDPVTGRRRHMSPDECWQSWIDRGWRPEVTVAPDEADDLFRPYEIRRCRRALVTLVGNEYHHGSLEPWHDQEVAVGYDIQDASRVWVREVIREAAGHRLGRLIAIAEWNGHQTRMVPVSVEERGREQRVARALDRLADRAEAKRAELTGPRLLDHRPVAAPMELTAEQEAIAEAEIVRLTRRAAPEPATAGRRPVFGTDIEMVRWLIDRPEAATARDAAYLRDGLRIHAFRLLVEVEGLRPALDRLIAAKAPGAGAARGAA